MNFDILDLCKKSWTETKNPNYYLLYKYSEINPFFLTDNCQRSLSNDKNFQDQKSILEILVNSIMTHGKKNAGKKYKISNVLIKALKKSRIHKEGKNFEKPPEEIPLSWYLACALLKVAPEKTTRSMRYGSGSLTRAVNTTWAKKTNWFVKELVKLKSRNFAEGIAKEIENILQKPNSSKLYVSGQACETMASKANIQ